MENEHGTIGKSEIELNNGLQFKVSICFTGTNFLKIKHHLSQMTTMLPDISTLLYFNMNIVVVGNNMQNENL